MGLCLHAGRVVTARNGIASKLSNRGTECERGGLLAFPGHQTGPAMRLRPTLAHDPEFGSFVPSDRLPLIRLRERRRELVLSLQGASEGLTRERIREIAEVQQAIKAVEAVIAD